MRDRDSSRRRRGHAGGNFAGTRLSFPLADKVPMAEIGATLAPLLEDWASHRAPSEGFGDFCARRGADGRPARAGGVLAA